MDAYVELHGGNPGHGRAGVPALEPSAASLSGWVSARRGGGVGLEALDGPAETLLERHLGLESH